jgi:hypothetical protein
MKPIVLALGFTALLLLGCSNQSDTTGPQAMPVELSVWVQEPFHGVSGATVMVANMRAVTDTSGLAVFQTDINVLLPNHTYSITVTAPGFTQAFPEADTVRIPSSPNQPNRYELVTTVQMKLALR